MNRRLMKAGEKNYFKESNGTKANCNANVTQVWKSRIYNKTLYNLHKTWSQEYNPNHLADINWKACLRKNIFLQLVLYTFSIVILTA